MWTESDRHLGVPGRREVQDLTWDLQERDDLPYGMRIARVEQGVATLQRLLHN